VSGLPLASKKFRRNWVADALGFTSVMEVAQPPATVRSGREPALMNPEMDAAPCSTVNTTPSTVIVPTRAAPVLAATWKFTLPLPVPELVLVIHVTDEVAVHVHPAVFVTVKIPLPPAAANACPPELSETVQIAPAEFC
jgi:hypothetical protein